MRSVAMTGRIVIGTWRGLFGKNVINENRQKQG